MNDETRNDETSEDSSRPSSAEPGRGKLPYQKPAFRYEGVFETMALACGKLEGTQAQCMALRKAS